MGRLAFQFSLQSLFIVTLFVAFIAAFVTSGSDWALNGVWILGAVIGVSKARKGFIRILLYAAAGGGLGGLIITPFLGVIVLQEGGVLVSSYPITYTALYFLLGGLASLAIGAAGGAVIGVIAWLFLLLLRRYMRLMDKLQRPMTRH